MNSAHFVRDELVFIDDEQLRTLATQKTCALCFEGRYDHARIQIERQITSGDADIPATRPPLCKFVVRECARGNGENRLTFQRWIEQLKNVGLARASRRLHDHILAGSQCADRILLPEIGNAKIDLQSQSHRRRW